CSPAPSIASRVRWRTSFSSRSRSTFTASSSMIRSIASTRAGRRSPLRNRLSTALILPSSSSLAIVTITFLKIVGVSLQSAAHLIAQIRVLRPASLPVMLGEVVETDADSDRVVLHRAVLVLRDPDPRRRGRLHPDRRQLADQLRTHL